MYDKNAPAAVKAARLMALRAAVAWAMHYQMPRILPDLDGKYPEAESSFSDSVRELALAAKDTPAKAEAIARGAYAFLMFSMRQVNEEVQGECPNHPLEQDLCHGTFAELFPNMAEDFGMTPEEALDYLTGIHRITQVQCAGFTATPAALAGCTARR
jgi:hypothetical protein